MIRTHLGRATSLTPAQRLLFRALIDELIATGRPLATDDAARRIGLSTDETTALMIQLAEADWVVIDEDGALTGAYPFSVAPTGVTVRWDGNERHAMCAVDALGVGPLLGRAVEIDATCPHCGHEITIEADAERLIKRSPRSTVVIRRWTAGPAATSRCNATRFACSPDHAQEWLRHHGGPDDVIQSLEASFIEAREIIGDAYRRGISTHPQRPGGERTGR